MSNKLNHTMLSNGLDFLTRGLKEIKTPNASELKYGVLHIFAGILLVLKERLRQEHWTLLFSKIDKINKKDYEAGDFPGVEFRVILDHLEHALEIKISKDDKATLDEFRKMRNKIEHFQFEISSEAVKTISGRALQFVVDFIRANFDVDEFSENEVKLFEELEESAKEFKQYIEAKLKNIQERSQQENRDVFHCPECYNKSLVREDADFLCGICGLDGADLDDVISAHMENELNMDSYSAAKDGYDLPIHTCRACDEIALVPMNSSAKEFLCVNCGDSVPTNDLQHCPLCNDVYYCPPPEDEEDSGGGGLCGRCWDIQMAKD